MKSLLAILMLVSNVAFASYNRNDDVQVEYLSWCDLNTVVAQDDAGNLYIRANCSEQGLVCKLSQAYSAKRYIISASCQAPQ